MKTTNKLLASAMAMAVLGLAPPAQAFQVSVNLFDWTNPAAPIFLKSIVVQDGGAGDPDGVVNNIVSLGASPLIPGFTVQGSFYSSKLLTDNFISSSSNLVTNATGVPVMSFVAVSDNDYQGPVNTYTMTASFTGGIGTGLPNDYVTFRFYDDPQNSDPKADALPDGSTYADYLAAAPLYSPGNLEGTCPFYIANGHSDSCDLVAAVNDTAPFGMSLQFDLLLQDGSALVGRSQAGEKTIPEPASMALLGLGLVGLAATRRRFVRV